ncbi:MAG TPA: polyribonucleotide nucleotidyltransferase [Fibrobacteria bacterium]|nr:polyribonucleotide nucleotidyltransferase [Fibrobacteria bacterium]
MGLLNDTKREVSIEIAPGKVMTIQTGKLAKQAHGSAVVRCGDTMVMVTACEGNPAAFDFFPLTVEYRESAWSAGRIPGGYFKREGKPSEKEILTCRIIDRPLRPSFPDGYKNEVQVIGTVISADDKNDPDVLGLVGGAAAVWLSPRFPVAEPIAGVRVVMVDGEFIVNPTYHETERAELELVMAASEKSISMVEGGAFEVPEEKLIEALDVGHEAIRKIIAGIKQLQAEMGVVKNEWTPPAKDEALYARVKALVEAKFLATFRGKHPKTVLYPALDAIKVEAKAALADIEDASVLKTAMAYLDDIKRDAMREVILTDGIRPDGRTCEQTRQAECEVTVLPRAHGSAIFQRGETLGLVTATLGTRTDEQRIDSLRGETFKNYMLHYNFPPYSVGEVKRVGSTGRREIGHGHLAERSLAPVLPTPDSFPYTLRVVSEILESNGSSSMASVCGGSLALMDAGVPIKEPVAGIAMGLIAEGDRIAVLSDITGTEDHLGDMDFKICGTTQGITGFQMDIKLDNGLPKEIMRKALAQARAGRENFLAAMNATLPQSRKEISQFAPAILSLKIPEDKIRELIGPGGKVIRGIQEESGAVVNVDDSGNVTISAVVRKAGQKAYRMIQEMMMEAEVGKTYPNAKVKSITSFGAFVEFLPGKEGLVHISELENRRVEKVEDVVALGDQISVKCIGIDGQGKVRLSRKATLAE